MAKFNLFFTIFSKSFSLNLIIGLRTSYYISKFAENCAADKVSYSWPSIYIHFFGTAMISSRNRVFFRTYQHFERIHKITARHIYIIHIRGIRYRKIFFKVPFFSSICPLWPNNFIFSENFNFDCVIALKREVNVIEYYYQDVSTFDAFLISGF